MENENNFVEENKLFESFFFSHLTSPKDSRYRSNNGHFVMGLGSQADMSGNTTLPVDVEIDLQQQIVLLKQELSDVKAELLLVTNKNKELIKEAKAVGRNFDTNIADDSDVAHWKSLYVQIKSENQCLKRKLEILDQVNNEPTVSDIPVEPLSEAYVKHLTYLDNLQQKETSSAEEAKDEIKVELQKKEAEHGWSTEKGSIADQLREAAHEALNEAEGNDSSQMVWCDDYQMYYDHNTQFYYTEDMSMSYEADSGTYYSLNKDTNEYEYYSQVEPTDTTAQDPMGPTSARMRIVKLRNKKRRKKRKLRNDKRINFSNMSGDHTKMNIDDVERTCKVETMDVDDCSTSVQESVIKQESGDNTVETQCADDTGECSDDSNMEEGELSDSEDEHCRDVDIGLDDLEHLPEHIEVQEDVPDEEEDGEISDEDNGELDEICDMNLCVNHTSNCVVMCDGYKAVSERYRIQCEQERAKLFEENAAAVNVFECGPQPPTEKNESDSHIWPPCIRVMVLESETLPVGSLHIITCPGGTVGSDKHLNHVLCIPDQNISKMHAEFLYNAEEKCYYIQDRGSRNGTYVNAKLLPKSKSNSEFVKLSHLDKITITSNLLELHIHAGSDTCEACEPGLIQQDSYLTADSATDKEQQRREGLLSIKKKYKLQGGGPALPASAKSYSDRAERRRRTVGSDNPHQKDDAPSSVKVAISGDNKGHKLLQKMGWKEGTGLGKEKGGIQQPIQTDLRLNAKAGLGSSSAAHVSIDNAGQSDRNAKWRRANERYQKISTGDATKIAKQKAEQFVDMFTSPDLKHSK